jgi:hypothetical protein
MEDVRLKMEEVMKLRSLRKDGKIKDPEWSKLKRKFNAIGMQLEVKPGESGANSFGTFLSILIQHMKNGEEIDFKVGLPSACSSP